jgi:hypothetical protein
MAISINAVVTFHPGGFCKIHGRNIPSRYGVPLKIKTLEDIYLQGF